MSTARVVIGDCRSVMQEMAAQSVDAIVCDPPYGLSFMGKGWDRGVPGVEFWIEALRVAKPGAHLVAFGGTRTYHRLTCAIEDAGWEIRDCLSWLYGSGFPKSHNGVWGGTALKPAWEPCILARNPLAGTVQANHGAFGTGALNIDACRIEGPKATGSGSPPLRFGGDNARPFHAEYDRRKREGEASADKRYTDDGASNFAATPGPRGGDERGRWPANVVIDEAAAEILDEQSGELGSGAPSMGAAPTTANAYGKYAQRSIVGHADSGGASRFFYTAKAPRSEREHGLEALPESLARRYGEQGQGPSPQQTPRTAQMARNVHPTVKPVELMRWLCRLVTPPQGLILDPFCGSGSTGVAAIAEGFAFVGIELEEEYAAIANARLVAAQPSLFGPAA